MDAISILKQITANDKFGPAANGKALGLLKLTIKWAKAEKDPEAKKMLTDIVKSIKAKVWDKLEQEAKDELNKL